MLTYRNTHEQQPNLRRIAALLRVGFMVGLLALVGLLLTPQQPLAAQTAAGCQVNTTWQLYTVVSGDTLAKIARRFNSSINALIVANCLTNPNRILVGQQLYVPPGSPTGGSQVVVGATYMPFERGFMIWRGDIGTITVYYGRGTTGNYETFPIWSYAFLPENPQPGQPPANFFKPFFGFGKVWGNYPHVRNALGWAYTPEQGYAAVYNSNPPQVIVNIPNNQRVWMLNGQWTFHGDVPTPTPSVTTYDTGASYQPFERGFMIWFASTSQIYVFAGNTPNDGPNGGSGTFSIFPSESYGNLPANPLNQTPPFNLYHPVQGFGRVWWNFPTTRSKLGWALQPEFGYLSNMRFENNVLTSITVPDGRRISLAGGGWGMPKVMGDKVENGTPVPPTAGILYAKLIETRPDNLVVHVEWEVSGDSASLEVYDSDTATSPINVVSALPVVGGLDVNLPTYTANRSVKFVIKGLTNTSTTAAQELVFPMVAPPQPTPSPTVAGVEVRQFAVEPISVSAENYTLNVVWEVAGVESVQLQWFDNSGDATPNESFSPLSLKGSQQIIVPVATTTNGDTRIVMWGWQGNTVILQRELFVPMLPQPTVTPESPVITTQAAYQPYEDGFALWRADTGEIRMFYNTTGRVEVYPQSYYEGFPPNPVIDTPPAGLVLPINGFGKLWGNLEGVRLGLGWGMAAEQGYMLEITTETDPGGGTRYLYTLPDGRQAAETNGQWHYID